MFLRKLYPLVSETLFSNKSFSPRAQQIWAFLFWSAALCYGKNASLICFDLMHVKYLDLMHCTEIFQAEIDYLNLAFFVQS